MPLHSLPASALRRVLPLCAVAAGLVVPCAAPAQQHQPPHRAAEPELPFAVGERASYAVNFGPLRVGSGSMEVVGRDTIRGEETLHLRFTVKGGTFFYRVDDVMDSWLEPRTMRSLRFTQGLNEGRRHYVRRFDFFADSRTFLQEGKTPQPSVAAPLDEASFFYFVRTQRLDVGQSLEYDRYFRPASNPVRLRVLRRERVKVPAGTFDALVVQPVIRTSGIFSEGGRAELWISDDPSHVVLQLKSQLSFGSLNLYLERYEPGGQTSAPAPAVVSNTESPGRR